MCVGNEELIDPIVFFGGSGLLAATAAFLGAVFRQRLALDVTAVRQSDHHVGRRDQVFGGQVLGIVFNEAAACANFGLAKLLAQLAQLFTDDALNGMIRAEYNLVPFVCFDCAKNTPGERCN